MKMIFAAALGCVASLFANASARAVTAVPPTQPESFTGVYTPTLAQNDGALVYGANLPASEGGSFQTGEQSLFSSEPAGVATTIGPITVNVPTGATNMVASVFSVYDLSNAYVTLVLNDTAASTAIGESFSQFFSNASYSTESDLATALTTGNATYLKDFFDTYTADFPVISGTTATGDLVNFSVGTAGGSAQLNFTPAPEPSTWAALCVGGVALGLGWRRRTARA